MPHCEVDDVAHVALVVGATDVAWAQVHRERGLADVGVEGSLEG